MFPGCLAWVLWFGKLGQPRRLLRTGSDMSEKISDQLNNHTQRKQLLSESDG